MTVLSENARLSQLHTLPDQTFLLKKSKYSKIAPANPITLITPITQISSTHTHPLHQILTTSANPRLYQQICYHCVMTDQELNVQYWLDGVDDALVTASALIKVKIYHHALFYCQLAVEKQLKALFVQRLNKSAPPTHNLVDLAKSLKLPLTPEQINNLQDITDFNVASRYDSATHLFRQKANRKFGLKWYKITQETIQWLTNN